MKKWERALQEQQRMTVTKRLAYGTAGFISSGFLGLILFFLLGRLTESLAVALLAGASFVLFFTVCSFFAGDRMMGILKDLWETWFGV